MIELESMMKMMVRRRRPARGHIRSYAK